jgi:hypothetical protein
LDLFGYLDSTRFGQSIESLRSAFYSDERGKEIALSLDALRAQTSIMEACGIKLAGTRSAAKNCRPEKISARPAEHLRTPEQKSLTEAAG